MDSIQPSSNRGDQPPVAKDAAKSKPAREITNLAQSRVPVNTAPVREADHNITLTPTQERTLQGLLPWMQIQRSASNSMNEHQITVY